MSIRRPHPETFHDQVGYWLWEPATGAIEEAFRTERCTVEVDIHVDGTWSYEQDTLLIIPGQSEPFHHTDRNRLRKVGEPTPNPTALAARGARG